MDDAASRLRARADELAPLIYGRVDTAEAARRRDEAIAELESLRAEVAAAVSTRVADDAPLRRPRRRPRRLWVAGAALAAVAVGVTVAIAVAPRPSADVGVASPSPTSTPRPTATPTRTPTPTLAPVAQPVVTPPPEQTDFRPEYYEADLVSAVQVPLNGAPLDNANGAVVLDDYGVPLSYVVADGDVFELIAKRFDIGTTYLAGINAVRRDEPTVLYVGDTLNLGATTILRIGDQNGVVYDHTDRLPEPHAPQD